MSLAMRDASRDIGLVSRTAPVDSAPRLNGMAGAFRTRKRDDVRVNSTPDGRVVIEQLPACLTHNNEVHPHHALGDRSPRDYIMQTREAPLDIWGGHIPIQASLLDPQQPSRERRDALLTRVGCHPCSSISKRCAIYPAGTERVHAI